MLFILGLAPENLFPCFYNCPLLLGTAQSLNPAPRTGSYCQHPEGRLRSVLCALPSASQMWSTASGTLPPALLPLSRDGREGTVPSGWGGGLSPGTHSFQLYLTQPGGRVPASAKTGERGQPSPSQGKMREREKDPERL